MPFEVSGLGPKGWMSSERPVHPNGSLASDSHLCEKAPQGRNSVNTGLAKGTNALAEGLVDFSEIRREGAEPGTIRA
jgi:hypothetical protein